jgi:hypothetical protein
VLEFQALAALFAVVMLVRHLPRALLFVAPALLRARGRPPAAARSPAEGRVREELAALGFSETGTISERGPLGAFALEFAVFTAADGKAWADLSSGRTPAIRIVTRCADGALLVTAAAGWPGRVHSSAGGRAFLPDPSPGAAVAAHRKGLEAFEREHGPASAPADLAARLRAARDHLRGRGGRELRAATAVHFANALLAMAILAAAVKVFAPSLKP